MKKIITTLFVFVSFCLSGQYAYFNTGVNMTNYDYKNSQGTTNDNLKSSSGSYFEIGYGMPLDNNRSGGSRGYSKLKLKTGLSLSQYNATGGNTFDNYDWETQYLGLRAHVEYIVLANYNFTASVDGGFGFETLLSGNQKIGGTTYNLSENDEFKGLFISPKFGVNVIFNVSEAVGLSGGFHYMKSVRMKGAVNGESLSFNTTQLNFGVIVQLY